MQLADSRNKFLFEIRPDLFPHGYLTDTELEMWELYYQDKQERRDG